MGSRRRADDVSGGDDGADDGADDGSIDDVSADDGVVRLPGAPSVDDVSADDDAGVPNAVVVAQGITNIINDIIDSNYGTPPPTPAPVADEETGVDDVVSTINDAISNIVNP